MVGVVGECLHRIGDGEFDSSNEIADGGAALAVLSRFNSEESRMEDTY